MKILVISDITFNLILKEINAIGENFIIEIKYLEDINTFFYEDVTIDYDAVFFHSDLLFHLKEIEWQIQLLNNLINFTRKNPLIFTVSSNTFNQGYKSIGRKSTYSQNDGLNLEFHDLIIKLLLEKNYYYFDFRKIIFELGFKNCYNYVLGAMYQMPYNKSLIKEFSTEFVNFFKFITLEEKKIIVVDCDNTLWKGILGEDGVEGVKCDKNHEGVVYYYFQKFLKEKIKEGFLLCICSKNNYNEVEYLFKQEKFPLKWDDFLIKKINWNEKYLNIKEIANELNISENSMIFIDDNPFELNSVLNLTEVKKGILFKNSYENLFNIIQDYSFQRKRILADDNDKQNKYISEQNRKQELNKFKNIDEYLNSLDLKLSIHENDVINFDRVSQMTEKTNQFNLNKRRFTENELIKWEEDGNKIFTAKLIDKYGDYGIIALILLERKTELQFQLENYLISCRALGKKLEEKIYFEVEKRMNENKQNITLIKFKKTEKNKPAELFIKSLETYGYNIKKIE